MIHFCSLSYEYSKLNNAIGHILMLALLAAHSFPKFKNTGSYQRQKKRQFSLFPKILMLIWINLRGSWCLAPPHANAVVHRCNYISRELEKITASCWYNTCRTMVLFASGTQLVSLSNIVFWEKSHQRHQDVSFLRQFTSCKCVMVAIQFMAKSFTLDKKIKKKRTKKRWFHSHLFKTVLHFSVRQTRGSNVLF